VKSSILRFSSLVPSHEFCLCEPELVGADAIGDVNKVDFFLGCQPTCGAAVGELRVPQGGRVRERVFITLQRHSRCRRRGAAGILKEFQRRRP